jgi:hypothetical protein
VDRAALIHGRKQDLGTSEFPEVETSPPAGALAFRPHKGGHTTGPNRPAFLAFADRYIKLKDAPSTGRPVKAAVRRLRKTQARIHDGRS